MSRDNMMALSQPTKEEIARTIFIGNITEGVGGDEGLERILRCAGSLRRWTRCTDADNKPCKFGFAEYEDAESLETAAEIFQNVKVPVKKPGKKPNSDAKPDTNGDVKMEDGEEESKKEEDASMEDGLEMTTLLVSFARLKCLELQS
jgi:RNA-binding protein 25